VGATVSHPFFTPYPKYLQIRELLMRRLARDLVPGDRLPTENALSSEFGVARETVREALRGLEQDGLIVRRRRNGTFVAKRPAPGRERRLTGLSEDFSELKFDTSATVLDAKPTSPPASVMAMMGLAGNAEAFHIGRLRYFEKEPLSYEEAFLPLDIGRRVAKLDLRNTAIVHELRERLRLKIWEEQQQIEAVAADPYVAGLLAVAVGAPLLFVVRHFCDQSDKSVVVFWSHLRPDRYYYTLKLERPRARRKPTKPARV
jgi:DNA-binding GntR family transcriptional regulator